MGCAGSKPEVKAYDKSRDTTVKSRGAPAEEPLPDFACASHYKVMRMLGEGGSGETWLCKEVLTGAEVAVKYIPRPIPKIVLPMIFHEVKIQAALGEGHVNLVQAREVVLSKTHLGLAMEYVNGGNLTAYVMDKFDSTGIRNGLYMTEPEAQYFFKQFLNAVDFLHTNRVAHRDIKLDNIVLDKSSPPRIKLCDFGFAKNWNEESNMYTQIGTPVYMSPQVISSKNSKKGYDAQKADVWACGVLLFVMVLGMFPFEHSEHPDPNSSDAHVEVWLQQIKGSWRENPRVAEHARKLSANCVDLLDKIFELDEAKRIDIPAIRKHAWYNTPLPAVYERALQDLASDQAQIEERLKAAENCSHHKHRDVLLQKIVDRAGVQYEPSVDPDTVARVWLGRIKPAGITNHHGIEMESVEECDEQLETSPDASRRAKPRSAKTTILEEWPGGTSTDGSAPLPVAPQQQEPQQQQQQQQPDTNGTGEQARAQQGVGEAAAFPVVATNGHGPYGHGTQHQQHGPAHHKQQLPLQQQTGGAVQVQLPTIIGPAPAAEATTVA